MTLFLSAVDDEIRSGFPIAYAPAISAVETVESENIYYKFILNVLNISNHHKLLFYFISGGGGIHTTA